MIIQSLLDILIAVLTPLINSLPVIDINVPTGILGWVKGIFTAVSMFLPISTMLTIFGLSFVVTNFSIVWKLIMKIWNALPLT